ncbi:UFD1-domain-containing protein [Coniochaeta ligniaria NRRL 30616]|uniref:UFD1-domain-containing protein n=1 Tax=Coniochaeta ligniaria NRRL 30616 TaxID=1408157 RepID=A0A1J7IJ04_9PEZI|nr:UFD1-domain-containing protein [Coniochaeta ligniaria NRRL 30616]
MYGFGRGGGFDPSNPEHLYQMARGRRPVVQRFDEYYRCYPMVMAAGPERPELNFGSKILLPPSALDKVSKLHVQWPIMLELINGAQQKHTHAGVLEFVAEEGRAYIPQWMMQTLKLDVGDMIQIKTTSLELAKLVKLQPQSVKFLEVSDPRAVLENAFRNFAAVTKGDIFAFEYNGEIYEMAVLDVKPETPKMGVSMIETDVSVDFAPPVGYVEPSVQKPTSRAGSGTSTPRSVRGGGLPAGGLLHSQGTMAQAINYDAIAPGAVNAAAAAGHFFGEGNRLAPSKKSSKTATPTNKPATPVPTETLAAIAARRRNGPMPLRLGPNRLFFGYEITPVKTAADKEAELQAAKQPHFAGQGQTLRGGVKKEGAGDKDKGKAPESKKPAEAPNGRRLDGRAV